MTQLQKAEELGFTKPANWNSFSQAEKELMVEVWLKAYSIGFERGKESQKALIERLVSSRDEAWGRLQQLEPPTPGPRGEAYGIPA